MEGEDVMFHYEEGRTSCFIVRKGRRKEGRKVKEGRNEGKERRKGARKIKEGRKEGRKSTVHLDSRY